MIDVAYNGEETGTFTNKSPRKLPIEINLEDSKSFPSKRINVSTKRMKSEED